MTWTRKSQMVSLGTVKIGTDAVEPAGRDLGVGPRGRTAPLEAPASSTLRARLRYSLGEYSGLRGMSLMNLLRRSKAEIKPELVEMAVAGWWRRSPRVSTLVVCELDLVRTVCWMTTKQSVGPQSVYDETKKM